MKNTFSKIITGTSHPGKTNLLRKYICGTGTRGPIAARGGVKGRFGAFSVKWYAEPAEILLTLRPDYGIMGLAVCRCNFATHICKIRAGIDSEDDVCMFFGEFSKEHRANDTGEVVCFGQGRS